MTPALAPTISVRVKTPDGTLFVHVLEDERKLPEEILLNIGKSGFSLQAWANALARVASLALRRGVSLREIAHEVSGITTDRSVRAQNGVTIRSGPEGLAHGLLQYLRHDESPRREDDDGDEGTFRPARFRHLE